MNDEGLSNLVILIIVLVIAGSVGTGVYFTTKPQPDIQVQDMSVSESVGVGETVNVEVTIKNLGDSKGSEEITLMVDGEQVREVSLEAGESQILSFEFVEESLGTYNLSSREISKTVEVSEPAEFEISNLQVAPEEAELHQEVMISVDVSNIGEKSGEYNVKLKVDGTTENTKTISLNGGENTTATFTLQKETKKSYSVEVENLSSSFKVLEPVEFKVENFTINPKTPVVGEDFTASVDLKNTGGTEGTYKAVWKVEGRIDDSHSITLGPGESGTVNFSMVWEEAGNYNVSIGKLTKNIEIKPAIEIVKKRRFDITQTWISGIIRNNSSRNLLPKIKVKYYQEGTCLAMSSFLLSSAQLCRKNT